ncbi:MAG: hypothetical protein SGPRY_010584 [Prymnesium sp.]
MVLLLRHGADPHVRRHDGETLAHGAAKFGHVHILRELQALGVDMQAESNQGETPRQAAERRHQTNAVRFLAELESGSQPRVVATDKGMNSQKVRVSQ